KSRSPHFSPTSKRLARIGQELNASERLPPKVGDRPAMLQALDAKRARYLAFRFDEQMLSGRQSTNCSSSSLSSSRQFGASAMRSLIDCSNKDESPILRAILAWHVRA